MSFFDPKTASNGQPYSEYRFKELVKQRYIISKRTHTSYEEAGKLTPVEREEILSIINEEIKRDRESAQNLEKQLKK